MALSIKQSIAQEIAETVKDVCSHDINFINTKGIIFASTNPQRIGDFHEIGRQTAVTGETIEVFADDQYLGTKMGVNMPFMYEGEIMAVIGISGPPEEVRKYAYLAQKIAMLILREDDINVHEHFQRKQITRIVHSLITNEYINPDYLFDFLKKNLIPAQADYRTIVAKLNAAYHPSNLSMIEHYIYQAFDETGSVLYATSYSNEYVLLIEADHFEKYQYIFQNLSEKYSPFLKIGVGFPAPLLNQFKSYKSARIALNSLLEEKTLAIFDQLDLEIVLGDISDETRQYFLEQTIRRLNEKDKKILSSYFLNDMSLKKTCEQLYLHTNTLQYQLDKIGRLTGYNPRRFRDAVVLYLALNLEEEK